MQGTYIATQANARFPSDLLKGIKLSKVAFLVRYPTLIRWLCTSDLTLYGPRLSDCAKE